MPAAPATQPRPKIGTRRTSGRRPSRPAMRASSDGTAMPVTVVVTIKSTSLGCRPASSRAPDRAAQPSSTACSMKRSLVSPKSLERQVLLHRKDGVPAVDLRAGVQAAEGLLVSGECRHLDEHFGDLILGVPVRRDNSVYACNNTHSLRHEAQSPSVRSRRCAVPGLRADGRHRNRDVGAPRPTTAVPTNSIGP